MKDAPDPKTGRLIAFVGPSGVGKDSVMAAVKALMPDAQLVKRHITRAPGLGGEEYSALSEADFNELRNKGEYALSWGAHGLYYGIPKRIGAQLAQGTDLLVNLSRGALSDANHQFDRFVAFNITADPQVLAERLAARGRETPEEIAKRLARGSVELPADLPVHSVENNGPLQETARAIVRILES